MQQILTQNMATISELKASPAQLLKNAGDEAIAIINNNIPTAYLVPSALYEKLIDVADDYYLSKEVDKALKYKKEDLIEVNINEL